MGDCQEISLNVFTFIFFKQIKELLDRGFMERTRAFPLFHLDPLTAKKSKPEPSNPYLQVTDLQTVHEAYQFLLMKYVEKEEDLKLKDAIICDNDTFSFCSAISANGLAGCQPSSS